MYQKPMLERFGTFRELTLQGGCNKVLGSSDGYQFNGQDIICQSS